MVPVRLQSTGDVLMSLAKRKGDNRPLARWVRSVVSRKCQRVAGGPTCSTCGLWAYPQGHQPEAAGGVYCGACCPVSADAARVRPSGRGRAVIGAPYARGQKGTGIDSAFRRYRRAQCSIRFSAAKPLNRAQVKFNRLLSEAFNEPK